MGAMDGKVCIVTGANTGIGKETARGLASQGATVVLACRDTVKGQAALDDVRTSTGNAKVTMLALDLANRESIRAFVDAFKKEHTRLDVLVNNAGLFTRERRTTPDGFESTFGVNHVGTFYLTHLLLDLLKASKPSRVVVVSSALHYRGTMDWDDLQFERRKFSPWGAYNQSKLANVLFTKELARRLEGSGVTVNALHPGVVATELTRDYGKVLGWLWNLFTISPAKGARTSLHVATAPELDAVSGQYFDSSREKRASKTALDEGAQKRLWTLTESMLGLAAN